MLSFPTSLRKTLLKNGFAYEVNGSIYFDVKKYAEDNPYGVISGRKIDELKEETRELSGQEVKRFFADFGLWKKASPEDMQIWRSPWGNGNPGWHIECSAMASEHLAPHIDIHGGGMDLIFPHHEAEIAQSEGFVPAGSGLPRVVHRADWLPHPITHVKAAWHLATQ